MPFKITTPPVPDKELQSLVEQATSVYNEHFDGEVWFGRCIFLSFYCEKGTCTFCFRSSKHATQTDPKKAKRSLASILTEALLIRVFNWRIEFLTGGYGILSQEELLRIIKLVSEALGRKIWVNLGEIGLETLEQLEPYVEGIVSSIETTNKEIHKQVCPDKPVEPYEEMIAKARKMNFKQSMTFIVGLGESKDDFDSLQSFIQKHSFERITFYALRPVKGTPFTKGPEPEEVAWWVAKTRIAFPKIEIIVGSAEYRIPEISLMLSAGANAITKLPATKMFNKENGLKVEKIINETGRKWSSQFSHPDPKNAANWDGVINRLSLTDEEKVDVKKTLNKYLDMMSKK